MLGDWSSLMDTVVSNTAKASEEKEDFDMTDTKLAKFEVILGDVRTWLGSNYFSVTDSDPAHAGFVIAQLTTKATKYGDFSFQLRNCIYHPSLFDKYASSTYVKSVLKATSYAIPMEACNVENDTLKFIRAYKSTPDTQARNIRNILVFWMLFLAALDDEIYNNELDSIIDIAYCMDFDEAMIRDWCRAVEYVMQGNRFSESCNLKCESEAGKQFFLHEGAIEAGRATAMDAVTAANSALTSSVASITKSLFQR